MLVGDSVLVNVDSGFAGLPFLGGGLRPSDIAAGRRTAGAAVKSLELTDSDPLDSGLLNDILAAMHDDGRLFMPPGQV